MFNRGPAGCCLAGSDGQRRRHGRAARLCAQSPPQADFRENFGSLRAQVEATLLAGEPADLLAVDLQTALDHLADIVGLTTPDDVLDAVFAKFCIGK